MKRYSVVTTLISFNFIYIYNLMIMLGIKYGITVICIIIISQTTTDIVRAPVKFLYLNKCRSVSFNWCCGIQRVYITAIIIFILLFKLMIIIDRIHTSFIIISLLVWMWIFVKELWNAMFLLYLRVSKRWKSNNI